MFLVNEFSLWPDYPLMHPHPTQRRTETQEAVGWRGSAQAGTDYEVLQFRWQRLTYISEGGTPELRSKDHRDRDAD